jgi:NAD(P)-dependent dehydrogenase (short-subunit alcohol dehydrogenase family)
VNTYGKICKCRGDANVVEFLASDKESYVTGATLFVDGMMTLYPGVANNEEHNAEKHSNRTRMSASKKRSN